KKDDLTLPLKHIAGLIWPEQEGQRSYWKGWMPIPRLMTMRLCSPYPLHKYNLIPPWSKIRSIDVRSLHDAYITCYFAHSGFKLEAGRKIGVAVFCHLLCSTDCSIGLEVLSRRV